MDVQYPYAEGRARQQLMYRLPLPAGPLRVLLVGPPGSGDLLAEAPGVQLAHIPAQHWLGGALHGSGPLDAVALPQTWRSSQGLLAPRLLSTAFASLAPGGMVIGHCDHQWALRGLTGPSAWWQALRSPVASPAACRRVLAAAGFVDVACFYVQPDMNDPMGLIPDDRAAARAQFLRAVRAEQGHFGALAYAARVLLAQLGLGGLQQAQIFFWARKPC